MSELVIKGGHIIDPATGWDKPGTLHILDGHVKGVYPKNAKVPAGTRAQTIDARDCWVVPGLMDMHVHLREPGREDEETIANGGDTALRGGFTAVVCMPNTQPRIDNQEVVQFVLTQAKKTKCKVYPAGAITKAMEGKEITEMWDMVDAGVVAFTEDGNVSLPSGILRNGMDYAKMTGRPILSHCEDASLVKNGIINEGWISSKLGLTGWPRIAEEMAIQRDIMLAEYLGCRLHIQHISTAGGLEIVKQAKQRGDKITCEVTPHHLVLTDEVFERWDTNCKVNPPLRTREDVEALRKGLAEGWIDAIATDHAPHSLEEKDCELAQAPFGIMSVECALGLVMTHLVHTGILTPMQMVDRFSAAPRKILDLPGGSFAEGAPADVTIIDPKLEWTVEPPHSLSKNCPYVGEKLKGRSTTVVVDGEVVWQA